MIKAGIIASPAWLSKLCWALWLEVNESILIALIIMKTRILISEENIPILWGSIPFVANGIALSFLNLGCFGPFIKVGYAQPICPSPTINRCTNGVLLSCRIIAFRTLMLSLHYIINASLFKEIVIINLTKPFASLTKGFASLTKGFASLTKGFASLAKGFASPTKGFVRLIITRTSKRIVISTYSIHILYDEIRAWHYEIALMILGNAMFSMMNESLLYRIKWRLENKRRAAKGKFSWFADAVIRMNEIVSPSVGIG